MKSAKREAYLPDLFRVVEALEKLKNQMGDRTLSGQQNKASQSQIVRDDYVILRDQGHDLRNTVTALHGFAELIGEEITENDEAVLLPPIQELITLTGRLEQAVESYVRQLMEEQETVAPDEAPVATVGKTGRQESRKKTEKDLH
ncbi:hypothetical protein [Aestuariispira insulae]|nr:hypothetical protein [Aestuariispira insulae]